MIEEIWKFIPKTHNLYEVSNLGRVRSVARKTVHSDGKITSHKSRILKQQLNHKGYPSVRISAKGDKFSFIVHRLVALAFIPNPANLNEVNHKDEDKTNNRFDNLEWCDTAYNVEYSQARTVKLLSPDGKVVELTNMAKFQRENNLSHVVCVVNGKRKQTKGWTLYVG